ncbi:MATE family efflux transporter [Roseovarius sp.]|uniref:MATE family efflux transporter n=1 Tax=Roseovarius sp. TaxID=1486281 RepID=UPI000C3F5588|nr:MATE family efflux transporter [Roseovarius sp.]MAZ19727.1 MATE family efflux transporter [Roseovarius sp.]
MTTSRSPARKSKFTSGPLMPHVARLSLTSSLGIMAIYVVDLCDIFFVSLLGENQMAAAAGFASTVMFFVSAMNVGVSMAAATLVSMATGAGDEDRARKIAFGASVVAVVVAVSMSALLLWRIEGILAFIGAEGAVAVMAKSYLWIVLPASFLSGISMVAVAALRTDNQARWAMYPSLVGAATNLALDPLFIFGLGFGLEGAAMATVAARVATLSVALYASARLCGLFARPTQREFLSYMPPLARFALPAVVSSMAAPFGMAVITRYMADYGPGAVAGMAVVGRLYPVVFSIVNALSSAVGPIVGQNFGAGLRGRVIEAYVASLKFLAFYVVVVTLLLFLFRGQIADAFRLEGLARDLVFLFCGPLSVIAFFNGTVLVSNTTLANIGYPRIPVWMQWGRSTLGITPFVALGTQFYGAEGVFLGATMGGGVFAALAALIVLRQVRRLDMGAADVPDVVAVKPSVPRLQTGWES